MDDVALLLIEFKVELSTAVRPVASRFWRGLVSRIALGEHFLALAQIRSCRSDERQFAPYHTPWIRIAATDVGGYRFFENAPTNKSANPRLPGRRS